MHGARDRTGATPALPKQARRARVVLASAREVPLYATRVYTDNRANPALRQLATLQLKRGHSSDGQAFRRDPQQERIRRHANHDQIHQVLSHGAEARQPFHKITPDVELRPWDKPPAFCYSFDGSLY